jgi:hypothetical protein
VHKLRLCVHELVRKQLRGFAVQLFAHTLKHELIQNDEKLVHGTSRPAGQHHMQLMQGHMYTRSLISASVLHRAFRGSPDWLHT